MKGFKIFALAALCLALTGCGAAEDRNNQAQEPDRQKSEAYLAWEDAVSSGYEGDFLDFLHTYAVREENGDGVLAARSGVVSIEATITQRIGGYFGTTTTSTLIGSGVVWKTDESTGDTYILTNYHVVYSAGSLGNEEVPHVSDDIKITPFGYGSEGRMEADFVGGSISRDIAVLKVDGSGSPTGIAGDNASILRGVTHLEAADSDGVRAGDPVYVIGNADGKGISVTAGVVSVEAESLEMNRLDSNSTVTIPVIRIDAAVNHGNSGGGLFDAEGGFLGIVNARSEKEGVVGFSYTIPSDLAIAIGENVLDRAEENEHTALRALLGIRTRTYCDGVGEDFSPVEQTFVASVEQNGACAGLLMADDRIETVTVGGVRTELTRTYMLEALLYSVRMGDIVTFGIVRNGVPMEVNVAFSGAAYFSAD